MSGTRTVEFCARRRTPTTAIKATASQTFLDRRERFESI